MRALYYEEFGGPVSLQNLPDPEAAEDSVVLKVEASGLCRSDWHGWMGHDPDIRLPHVPGHELAGTIIETGKGIKKLRHGMRVTVPFVGGCGSCVPCTSGNPQICDHQFQPGFTQWGSFAEYVEIKYADLNVVSLPDEIAFDTAASLGCRFITSYRGIIHQARVKEGDVVTVFACGGVGLSAIMIAASRGACVIAVDINEEKLNFAKKLGAQHTVNASREDYLKEIRELSSGGADITVDALGSRQTCSAAIQSLRKQGRHIQIGLMAGEDFMPNIPMHLVIANELRIIGSHGMPAHAYPHMLEEIKNKTLKPGQMIGERISLEEARILLPKMNEFQGTGISVITRF